MKAVNLYLNFGGNTEEAFTWYASVFGTRITALVRFRDFPMSETPIPEKDLDKIVHVALPIGEETILMGTDVLESWGRPLNMGNNLYIALECEQGDEADRIFKALSEEGKVEMPLQRTEWAERYGSLVDRSELSGW